MVIGLSAGGASSAASWATHGVCERYRGTDPLVTKLSRRKLAGQLGHADLTARIPEARWMRAMTFERLCHDIAFAGEVAARAAGWSGLSRPTSVVLADCHVTVTSTRSELASAASRASGGAATLLHSLAVPYPGLDTVAASVIKPDLAVVARGPDGPVLIVGDVKDYERVRSRIDDSRMLKGFLQVAMGSFAFGEWAQLPKGLTVSRFGFLAVPRSAFLQPAVEVEDLRDHRAEVVAQWRARLDALTEVEPIAVSADIAGIAFVGHLRATFDPATCPSCSLFGYCRSELRSSDDPTDLLIEIGTRAEERPVLVPLISDGEVRTSARPRTVARLRATITGVAGDTAQRRLDPAGLPGTVNVVVAKTDAAALGFYGLGVNRITDSGATPWSFTIFDDPQSPETRRKVMNAIGIELEKVTGENRKRSPDAPDPIHLVVPDAATADLLATAADVLAGIELSRLRWARDQHMGRPLLTYNGEPAAMPKSLEGARRSAVSFLLEQDRARMLQVRTPIINLTTTIARHIVPGGSAFEAARLDYVVEWAQPGPDQAVDHRAVSDDVAGRQHTPGARLANRTSDALHQAQSRARDGETGASARYATLVEAELQYKAGIVDRALSLLEQVPDSRLRQAYRSLESDAQRVWRRRKELRASDLVRFGRTYRPWRNDLVDVIQSDDRCADQVWALANPMRAAEQATDAGNRDVTWAAVINTVPLLLKLESRRFSAGDRVTLLGDAETPWVERDGVEVKPQSATIRLKGFCLGELLEPANDLIPLEKGEDRSTFEWRPKIDPMLSVGERVVLARLGWFKPLTSQTDFNLERPNQDVSAAPKQSCTKESYDSDPETHRWCCRPHELAEADFADEIALRRSRRELNPEVWPPVHDADGFEVVAVGKPTAADITVAPSQPPEGVTVDDLD